MLRQAFTDEHLCHAWDRVRSRNAAPGADGVTVSGFGLNLERNLRRLRREILAGRYRPCPTLRCHIPKADGDFRRIGIPAVRDRIAQRALLDILMPRIDPQLAPCSYAYRPRRSVAQAVSEVGRLRSLRNSWVARTDIDLCFESIPHAPLLHKLWSFVPDAGVAELVKRWITAGVVDGPEFQSTELGVQQGDVLSPVLCNVYLDSLDRDLLGRGHGLVRYADDMLIVCASKRAALDASRDAVMAMESLSLKADPAKTEVTSFIGGFRFLGTIFVGSLALPAVRVQRPDGSVHYTSGYEPEPPRISVERRKQGGVKVRIEGGPITDRELARMLSREVVRERRGEGTELGRALVEAWKELTESQAEESPDWEDHGSWAHLAD